MEILAVKNLSFTYPLQEKETLSDVSLTLREGEMSVLVGATGCGKSTLLRLLKRELAPRGERSGEVLYRGRALCELSPRQSAPKIGFVMQDPDGQIVCDTVAAELAFGLENLGMGRDEIAARVAEMASYFGIGDWYDRPTSELSGGQKQLLNLAAVMATDPDLLILDEPTAQLDPIAAENFIHTLAKINRDFSLTVLIAEHRLEELIPICDRLLVMENGRILHAGTPRDVVSKIDAASEIFCAMPSAVRLYHAIGDMGDVPLSAREGRRFLRTHCSNRIRAVDTARNSQRKPLALELRDVFFRYEKHAPDVLRHLDLSVYEGEILCLLGGNGSGKSTALSVIAGLLHAYAGSIRIFGKKQKEYKNQSLYRDCLALLPQDVQTVFLKNTVREELLEVGFRDEEFPFDLSPLYERHPYDLSGGEQQTVALAKVLAGRPRLLLMDEPTKGIDAARRAELIRLIKRLQARGVTVLIVTHDVEFAALCADRVALFFDGRVVSVDTPDRFFSQNRFYTTAASRMSRDFYDRAVTVERVAELCRLNAEEAL